VNILDCNDNAPLFGAVPAVVYVEENQPVGTSVFNVSANDLDRGDHGFVSYSLANTDVSLPFSIDHFTGVIHTKSVLDYETMRRTYSLLVRASDWGSPFRRETEILLKVSVVPLSKPNRLFVRDSLSGAIGFPFQITYRER